MFILFWGLAASLTGILLLPLYNYVIDITGILHPENLLKPDYVYLPSRHFIKVRHVLNNPRKYDAFAFGSSRVGYLHFNSQKQSGYRYYNMTYTIGVPDDWLADIKLFLKGGVKMKRIVLALDDFSYRVAPDWDGIDIRRVPYKENNLRTYLRRLFRKIEPRSKAATFKQKCDLFDTGDTLDAAVDEEIAKDVAAHINNEAFKTPLCIAKNANRLEQTMAALLEIKKIAADNGIDLIVLFNAVHVITYLDNEMDGLDEFKRQVAAVFDYWDFSGPSSITADNYYWIETSHPRTILGDMILKRVFGENGVYKKGGEPPDSGVTPEKDGLPRDFGYFVTKSNVEAHLKRLREKAEYYRGKLDQ